MTDTLAPITEISLHTTTTATSGTWSLYGYSLEILRTFTQSTIYDNSGGEGPFSTGLPLFVEPLLVRHSTAYSTYPTASYPAYPASTSSAVPTNTGKYIGILPLASFIGLMVGIGVLLCCCCCYAALASDPPPSPLNNNTNSYSSTYTYPSSSYRSTYTPRTTYTAPTPAYTSPPTVPAMKPDNAPRKPELSAQPRFNDPITSVGIELRPSGLPVKK